MRLAAVALASAVSVSAIVNPFGNKFDISKLTGGPVKSQASWNFIDCGRNPLSTYITSLTDEFVDYFLNCPFRPPN
jgi:hypothetical protein